MRILFCLVLVFFSSSANSYLIQQAIRRTALLIDIAKVTTNFTITNDSDQDRFIWIHAIDAKLTTPSISTVSAWVKERDDYVQLKTTPIRPLRFHDEPAIHYFAVYAPLTFPNDQPPSDCLPKHQPTLEESLRCFEATTAPPTEKPLIPRRSDVTLTIKHNLLLPYQPVPARVEVMGSQKMFFKDTEFIRSRYPIAEQTSAYRFLEDTTMLSYPERLRKGESKSKQNIFIAGPYYGSRDENSDDTIEFLFSHNHPYVHFRSAVRELTIGLLGESYYREEYNMYNAGAQLKGEYQRAAVDNALGTRFGRIRSPGPPIHQSGMAFSIDGLFPYHARKFEIFDENGNISSTYARRDDDGIHLHFEPRYPLVGGWTTLWKMNYNVPTATLVRSPKLFSFFKTEKIELLFSLSPPFLHTSTSKLKVRVVLPSLSTVDSTSVVLDCKEVIQNADRYGRPTIEFEFTGVSYGKQNSYGNLIQITYQTNAALAMFRFVADKLCIGLCVIFVLICVWRVSQFRIETASETIQRKELELEKQIFQKIYGAVQKSVSMDESFVKAVLRKPDQLVSYKKRYEEQGAALRTSTQRLVQQFLCYDDLTYLLKDLDVLRQIVLLLGFFLSKQTEETQSTILSTSRLYLTNLASVLNDLENL